MRRMNVALSLVCTLGLLVGTAKSLEQKSRTTEPEVRSSAHNAAISEQEIDLMQKDLRSQKKQVIAANMKLTDAAAEEFWPLYDRYTAETVKINDRKYELIQQYAEQFGHMSGQQAEEYVQGMIGVDQSTSELRLKYWPKFRQIISANNTALFFQMDRRINLMIDLQLSSQIPLIEP